MIKKQKVLELQLHLFLLMNSPLQQIQIKKYKTIKFQRL